MSPRAIYKYLTPHHSRILTINAMEFIQIFYINISNHKGLFIYHALLEVTNISFSTSTNNHRTVLMRTNY